MKASNMNGQTHAFKRGSVYYFRMKIPVDLLPHYSPKTEIRFSLKTSDKKEARRLAHQESAHWDQEFEQARKSRGLAMGEKPLEVIRHLDQVRIRAFCKRWEYMALIGVHQALADGTVRDYRELFEVNLDALHELKKNLAEGRTEIVKPILESYLYDIGVDLQCDQPSRDLLAFEFLKTLIKEYEYRRKLEQGDIPEFDAAATLELAYKSPATESKSDGPTVEKLLEDWELAVANRRSKTVDDFSAAVRSLSSFSGNKPASELERKDFVAYRDHLIQTENLMPGTVKKKLGFLRAIFQFGVDNEKLKINPVLRIKVPRAKTEEQTRLSFSVNDLSKIFSSGIYGQSDRPKGGGGEAAAWLPLLALFTGARLEELGQLRVSDVKQEKAGRYLFISDEGEGNRLKTESSRRRVPIHDVLISSGFLRFVQSVKTASGTEARLFPELSADTKGALTGNWSKWFGRYLRNNIGIKDARKVFHSFRHTFKDACREAGMNEEVHDALTGHAGSGVGRHYGSGQYPISRLIEAMARIHFEGFQAPVITP
jgi:integrase